MYTSSLLHSNTLCRCSGILNVYVISVNVLRRPNRGWETIQTSYVFSSVFVSHSTHSSLWTGRKIWRSYPSEDKTILMWYLLFYVVNNCLVLNEDFDNKVDPLRVNYYLSDNEH